MSQTPDYTFEITQLNALKNTKLAYLLRTDLQGNYTYANDKYVSDFGWIHGSETEFNFVGHHCLPSISAHHQALVADVVAKCIASPNTVFATTIDKPLQNGQIANTIWDFVCLQDANGNPCEMQCFGVNLDDLRQSNELAQEAQNFAWLEMSTPITQLWDGILLLPLVGIITPHRAETVMTLVLKKIAETQARVFILDISGVAVVDTAVANHFVKLAKATQLMGCSCTISGISPAVAQTIVGLGIQIEEINTVGSMRDALQRALQFTGVKMVRTTTD